MNESPRSAASRIPIPKPMPICGQSTPSPLLVGNELYFVRGKAGGNAEIGKMRHPDWWAAYDRSHMIRRTKASGTLLAAACLAMSASNLLFVEWRSCAEAAAVANMETANKVVARLRLRIMRTPTNIDGSSLSRGQSGDFVTELSKMRQVPSQFAAGCYGG